MIPLALRVKNFRSVRGEISFAFPRQPGLYFMSGDNQDEPRLEGNAAGKSTLWDALTWVAFGKTPRGLKAGDVCNWDAGKGAVVEFDYALAGVDCVWTVRRTWGPNTWTLRHVAEFVTDEEVIDLTKADSNAFLADLGLDFEPWLNCVLMAQRRPMFLDCDRNAQAALFADVMGLDRWLDFSARAGKRAGEQDAVTRGLEREASALEGRIAQLGSVDYGRENAAWERDRAARVIAVTTEHEELSNKARALKAALADAEAAAEDARKKFTALPPANVDSHRAALDDLRDRGADLRVARAESQRLHGLVEALEDDAACPACGQRLDREHRREEMDKAEAQLRDALAAVTKADRALAVASAKEERIRGDADADVDRRVAARDLADDLSAAARRARQEYESNERRLDRLEEDGEALANEVNPYRELQERAAHDFRRLCAELVELGALLAASEERHSVLSYWVRGFKELRLTQIAEALTELEVEVNSCVDALGLVDWGLGFQVDRETKGGGVQRGFSVSVSSPRNPRAVPWEAWSGGEGQRLRVAGNMGLADLVRSRTGATIPLEVWDEPTAGLSPQGVRDLLDSLAERARLTGRCVWIVDHRSHDFGGFAGGAVVTKTADGTGVSQF